MIAQRIARIASPLAAVAKALACLIAFAIMPASATSALAQVPLAPVLIDPSDSGDTAWILAASALVLLMTLPGLALFYGGLVRARHFLSVLLQCGAIAAVVSLLWVVVGYTLAFGIVTNGIVGSGNAWMLIGLGNVREGLTIPESSFVVFQMTFAIITPALMVGAWVERARFGWVVAFCALWSLIVYAPVAHWIWGGGWLAEMGALDFAGGIVVHTTAGVSALVAAIMLGKRQDWPAKLRLPHSPALTVAGAGLLWVGWFGFNGGSTLSAGDDAAAAIINTHVAASVAALIWLLIEKIKLGKSTAVGFATGAIAGLATITPAAGYISPGAAIIIGLIAAPVCYYAIALVKNVFAIDDSLDVFAVHGVGGILGSFLVAIFVSATFNGVGYADGSSMIGQLMIQGTAIAVVAIWSIIGTLIIGLALTMVLPMRVSKDDEREGLDLTQHGEQSWELD